MATIPLTQPYTLRDATLTIEEDDFTAAVSAVTFVPTKRQPWRGVGGNSVGAPADWIANLALAQDLAEDGLLRYLLDHEGEQKTMIFTPTAQADPIAEEIWSIGANVVCSPGQIGGARTDATIATSTAALDVAGRPAFQY